MLGLLIENVQKSQIYRHEAEYLELIQTKLVKDELPLQVQYESLKAFNRLVRLIKPSSFAADWHSFFTFAWTKLQSAKSYIERMGHIEQEEI